MQNEEVWTNWYANMYISWLNYFASRYLLFGNLGLAKNLLYHQILCYIQRQLLSQNIMGRKILNSSEQFLC